MLVQIDKTSGRATGDCQPGRSHMRDGASRNPAIQLRAAPPRLLVPVAPSRVEENDGASFLTASGAALRDVAAIASGILLITATGVGITVAIYFLLFCSF